MSPTVRLALAAVLTATGIAAAEGKREHEPPSPPADIGFRERAGTRLAQIDVTVKGDPESIAALTAKDFRVSVLRRRIDGVTLDRLCGSTPGDVSTRLGERKSTLPGPATFLFFFDQPHLTMAGRQRALDNARDLVRRLVPSSGRAMIVSGAKDVATVASLTDDPARLLDALDRLEKDPLQWDPYAQMEERRVAEVMMMLDDPTRGLHSAIGRAREYQAEEIWQSERSLSQLAMLLGALDPVDPPKAVIYFADTTREAPGGHYVELFGQEVLQSGASALLESDARFGSMAFDRLVNDAAAHGVRFYTVEAAGLASLAGGTGVATVRGAAGTDPLMSAIPSTIRVRAAQQALSVLALETGGQAFLNGAPAPKIAKRITDDLACLFLLSFDPLGLPEDQPLPVDVEIRKPGVEARARGRLVVQSAPARLTSRLLAAFATPESQEGGTPIRVSVVPTGYSDGSFGGLVQVFVPASPYSDAGWDLGASLLGFGTLREEASARISVEKSGLPVVLEREMRFSPGPYEIVAVAREISTDEIASHRIEGAWPDLRSGAASVGPIALLQPADGAFHRAGVTLPWGALAAPEDGSILRDLPAAFVTLVCRGRRSEKPLRVERTVTGAEALDLPPVHFEPGGPCAQIRDLIPAEALGPGEFRYEVRLLDGEREVAKGSRRIVVAEPTPES